MIKINLNPEKRKAKAKRKLSLALPKKGVGIAVPKKNLIFIAIPVVILTAEFAYLLLLNVEIKKFENKKRYLLAEKTKYRVAKRQIDLLKRKIVEAEKIKDNVALKIKIYNKLAQEKTDFGKILVAISKSIPDGVWLTKLDITRKKTNLKGYTFDPKFISTFYKNLQPYYEVINFKSTKRSGKGKPLVFYQFDFDMKDWKLSERSSKEGRGNRP